MKIKHMKYNILTAIPNRSEASLPVMFNKWACLIVFFGIYVFHAIAASIFILVYVVSIV